MNGDVSLHVLLGVMLIGAGVGFVSGAFGKGGSAISTPLLHAIGVPAMAALASPLPATIPSTCSRAAATHARATSTAASCASARSSACPRSSSARWCTRWIPGGSLVLATDALVLALGLRVLLARRTTTRPTTTLRRRRRVPRSSARRRRGRPRLGPARQRGGFLLAPLFMHVLHMPVRRALGTSLALAAVLAVPGTIVHAWLGHIDWTLTLAFGLAAVPLATVGARTALRMRERSLTLAFGAGLTLLAGGLLAFAR